MLPIDSQSNPQTLHQASLIPECIHCGLCLQACPTYVELGKEGDSPRGRIYLMRALERDLMPFSKSFSDHISACLGCRACESACPSGVPYGSLVESARYVIEEKTVRPLPVRIFRNFIFNRVFVSPRWLRFGVNLLRVYQRSGLQRIVRVSHFLEMFPGHLAELEMLFPDIRRKTYHVPPGAVYPPSGQKKWRVGLLTGCVMNEIFGDVHQATIRVLRRNGCEVVIPREQACCGALHSHSGFIQTARTLARRNIEAFERAQVDVILVNAAGCGAQLKEYGALLSKDEEFRQRAAVFSTRVKDISEFLVGLPLLAPEGKFEARVAYDDPCHLLHAQRISQPPRQLLGEVRGLYLVELENPDQCCGSAGTYNVVQYDLSMRILERKISDISKAAVDVVASGNPGCQLQIEYGLRRAGLSRVKVKHPIEILDAAYQNGQKPRNETAPAHPALD